MKLSKRNIKNLRWHKRRSCKYKKKYNLLTGLYRLFMLKIKDNENHHSLHLYKCIYGNHYHVGNIGKYTLKNVKYIEKLHKLILSSKEIGV